MPITTGTLSHTPYTIPPSNKPELRHLEPKKKALAAKETVLKLGEELRALDNTKSDIWTGEGDILVHQKDHHRNLIQRVFGTGEKMTAFANFENGELQKLEAKVYDADSSPGGSRTRFYSYQKSPDGKVTFAAPRSVNEWSEWVEDGGSKTTTYYRKVDHFSIDYTTVQESPDGTLTVDLHSPVRLSDTLDTY